MLLVLQIQCSRVASVFMYTIKTQKCYIFSEQKNDNKWCWIASMKNHTPSLALNSCKLKPTDRWTQDTTARLLGSQTDKLSWNAESLRKLSGFHQSFSEVKTVYVIFAELTNSKEIIVCIYSPNWSCWKHHYGILRGEDWYSVSLYSCKDQDLQYTSYLVHTSALPWAPGHLSKQQDCYTCGRWCWSTEEEESKKPIQPPAGRILCFSLMFQSSLIFLLRGQ